MSHHQKDHISYLFTLTVNSFVNPSINQPDDIMAQPDNSIESVKVNKLLSDFSDLTKDEVFVRPLPIDKLCRPKQESLDFLKNSQKSGTIPKQQKFLKQCIERNKSKIDSTQSGIVEEVTLNDMSEYKIYPVSPTNSIDSAIDVSGDVSDNRLQEHSDVDSAIDLNEDREKVASSKFNLTPLKGKAIKPSHKCSLSSNSLSSGNIRLKRKKGFVDRENATIINETMQVKRLSGYSPNSKKHKLPNIIDCVEKRLFPNHDSDCSVKSPQFNHTKDSQKLQKMQLLPIKSNYPSTATHRTYNLQPESIYSDSDDETQIIEIILIPEPPDLSLYNYKSKPTVPFPRIKSCRKIPIVLENLENEKSLVFKAWDKRRKIFIADDQSNSEINMNCETQDQSSQVKDNLSLESKTDNTCLDLTSEQNMCKIISGVDDNKLQTPGESHVTANLMDSERKKKYPKFQVSKMSCNTNQNDTLEPTVTEQLQNESQNYRNNEEVKISSVEFKPGLAIRTTRFIVQDEEQCDFSSALKTRKPEAFLEHDTKCNNRCGLVVRNNGDEKKSHLTNSQHDGKSQIHGLGKKIRKHAFDILYSTSKGILTELNNNLAEVKKRNFGCDRLLGDVDVSICKTDSEAIHLLSRSFENTKVTKNEKDCPYSNSSNTKVTSEDSEVICLEDGSSTDNSQQNVQLVSPKKSKHVERKTNT